MTDLIAWEQDKALYLFTSLTAGSSHVITATSRIETILKSARIPVSYIDTATNEAAKKLYQRRGKNKKLPLLVKEGFVIADLEQVEDWNEFGELREMIGDVATTATSHTTTPAIVPGRATGPPDASYTPSTAASAASTGLESSMAKSSLGPGAAISEALRKAAFESASAAKDKKTIPAALSTSTTVNPSPPPPAPTPVAISMTAPLSSPDKIPLPASPLKETHLSNIAEVMSPTPSGPVASPPSRVTSAGSSHSSHFVPEHFDPPALMHRGSSISQLSQEEIKEIESRETIQEEDEEEDEEDIAARSKPSKPEVKPTELIIEATTLDRSISSSADLPVVKEERQTSHSEDVKDQVA